MRPDCLERRAIDERLPPSCRGDCGDAEALSMLIQINTRSVRLQPDQKRPPKGGHYEDDESRSFPKVLRQVAGSAIGEHRHDHALADSRRQIERCRQRRPARHADEQPFLGCQPPRQCIRTLRGNPDILIREQIIVDAGRIAVSMCFNPSIPLRGDSGCTEIKRISRRNARSRRPVPINVPTRRGPRRSASRGRRSARESPRRSCRSGPATESLLY